MPRAPYNRTLTLTDEERSHYRSQHLTLSGPATVEQICDRTLCQDLADVSPWLPDRFVDLLFLDPPYNLTKQFNRRTIRKRSPDLYQEWFESWLSQIVHTLKPTASIYLCGDWQMSAVLHTVGDKFFTVRNRITWEREKGRGAKHNWKNCSEDIWFCTCSNDYYFDAEAVRLKRRVLAPYTHDSGEPKDWDRTKKGNFRLTAPSNLWTDLTIPFWSMPENTDHPTQKPEKLLAKIILASCPPNGMVLDPFLGSGTTSVVAKKLDRHYVGIEIDDYYACLAEKRLERAGGDRRIQGYDDQIFWERNSTPRKGS